MRTVSKILSIAILMTGFASCSKMDRVFDGGQTEIAMWPVMSSMSKAPVEGTTYPDTETFGVFAYYSSAFSNDQDWTDFTSVQPYFEKRKFVKDDEAFSGDPKCYWPHQGSLVFAGYSPYDLSGTPSFTPETKTLFIDDFFLSDGQTDLMYFLPKVSNGNLKGVLDSRSSVDAAFSHALALLEFNIKGIAGDEPIRLKGISLASYPRQGDFTVVAGGTAGWSGQTSAAELSVYDSGSPDDLKAGALISADLGLTYRFLVLPGTPVDITINYVINAVSDYSKSYTIEETAQAAEWATGKKYIYDITIASKFIVVDPSVGDYADGGGRDQDILG